MSVDEWQSLILFVQGLTIVGLGIANIQLNSAIRSMTKVNEVKLGKVSK